MSEEAYLAMFDQVRQLWPQLELELAYDVTERALDNALSPLGLLRAYEALPAAPARNLGAADRRDSDPNWVIEKAVEIRGRAIAFKSGSNGEGAMPP